MTITKAEIQNGLASTNWDYGNEVLYRLCRESFDHENAEAILAKVWLIGRSYAVAIERRRNKTDENDDFYLNSVCPAFQNSELDNHLKSLQSLETIDSENISTILEVHYYLQKVVKEITDLEKRSFASKYLHFHLPNLFYIYDSRAMAALRQYISRIPRGSTHLIHSDRTDKEYANFFIKCYTLQKHIEEQYGMKLTPRELDKILIIKANSDL